MASTDCNRPAQGFSSSDMVLTGCLSFLAGISTVLLFILLMKWKAERKLCFREKEEPCKGKWEGASRRATLQVLKKHTLERSHSERSENKEKQTLAVAEPNSGLELAVLNSQPVKENVAETSLTADIEHTLSVDNNGASKEVTGSLHEDQTQAVSETENAEEDKKTNVSDTKEIKFPRHLVTEELQREEAGASSNHELFIICANQHPISDAVVSPDAVVIPDAVVSPDAVVNIDISMEDDGKETENIHISNESLKAVQLYDKSRESSVFDPPGLIIQNDNFRISTFSVN